MGFKGSWKMSGMIPGITDKWGERVAPLTALRLQQGKIIKRPKGKWDVGTCIKRNSCCLLTLVYIINLVSKQTHPKLG